MNLLQFQDEVRTMIDDLSTEDLRSIIGELARRCPEGKRDSYLGILELFSANAPQATDAGVTADEVARERDELDLAERRLAQIADGTLCIHADLNEGYDDWHDGLDEEWLYSDPEGVLTTLLSATKLVHALIDRESYADARSLANKLAGLQVNLDGDCREYDCDDSLTLTEALSCQGGSGETWWRAFCIDALLATYCASSPENRAEALFDTYVKADCTCIPFATCMQASSRELDLIDVFLPQWLEHLAKTDSPVATALLPEAIDLVGDAQACLAAARKHSSIHPRLFEWFLKAYPHADKAQLAIGEEALLLIGERFVARGSVALQAAASATRLGRTDDAERLWIEAFRSDTSAVNFLRIMLECHSYHEHRAEVQDIYEARVGTAKEGTSFFFSGHAPCRAKEFLPEKAENEVNRTTLNAVMLLDGRFAATIANGMNVEKPLGWSSTFMKCGIALFVLYLCDEDVLPPCCRSMADMARRSIAFTGREYAEGLGRRVPLEDAAAFEECLAAWRLAVRPLADMPDDDILALLRRWTNMRVEGILSSKKRSYYGECALLVGAIGEVLESRGNAGAKQAIFEEYTNEYPRFSTFRKELHAAGMR